MHADSIDLLVTASVTALSRIPEDPASLLPRADSLGLLLTVQVLPPAASPSYCWQPVVELLAMHDDDLVLQVERTRLAYIEAVCDHRPWRDSPARAAVDDLGVSVRRRLGLPSLDPQRMILSNQEIAATTADWRRPVLYSGLGESGGER